MIVDGASLALAGSGDISNARGFRHDRPAYHSQLAPRTLILLSTYNGAAYLHEQLQSLLAQSHSDWVLYWRDDGSDDATLGMMSRFAAQVGRDRCVAVQEPRGRLWPTASFMVLLRSVLPTMRPSDCIAFADQDDVWLPDKLARGVSALQRADPMIPTLYCARLLAVNSCLELAWPTRISQRQCGFPAALTQNIATGCTVMLNRAAAALIASSPFPTTTFHDWWSYLLVSAAGGRVVVDETVVALYRQHASNFIGMPRSEVRRALAALRRGPGAFMRVLREHVAVLIAEPGLVAAANYATLLRVHLALQGNIWQRLRALSVPGLRRRGLLETWLFRLWFVIG